MSEAELKAKTAEADDLEKKLAATDARIAALTVESKNKRAEAQDAYIAAHKARFGDLDPALALIGAVANHEVKLAGASYFLSPPNGELSRQVDTFAMNPIVELKTMNAEMKPVESKEDLGPVNNYEQLLLQWLSAIQPPEAAGGGAKREISKYPIAQRLKLIRTLPAILIRRLAEECDTLSTYLSVVLERELGN